MSAANSGFGGVLSKLAERFPTASSSSGYSAPTTSKRGQRKRRKAPKKARRTKRATKKRVIKKRKTTKKRKVTKKGKSGRKRLFAKKPHPELYM